jgi:hypothetical protein
MPIGRARVEKTAAQVIEKQARIDNRINGRFGRILAKFCDPNYAFNKLKTFHSDVAEFKQAQQFFLRDLKNHPEKASPVVTFEEQYAVRQYTCQYFIGMNTALREPTSHFASDPYYGNLIAKTTSALAKLAKRQYHVGPTFRGMYGVTPHSQLKEGDTITERAFMSTSKHIDVAKDFAVLDTDRNPPTLVYTFGKSCASIQGCANNQTEKELIYPPNTQFKTVFAQANHELTRTSIWGRKSTDTTHHVVLEEANTPDHVGHSGILDALDLAGK